MLFAFHSIDSNALVKNSLEQVDPKECLHYCSWVISQVLVMVQMLGLMILEKLWHLKA